MKKKKNEKDIKDLDLEIQLAQIDKFIDDLDNSMKKYRREIFKKSKKLFLFIFLPFLLSVIGYFEFNSNILLMIGLGIAGSGITVKLIADFINDIKKMDKNYYNAHLESNQEDEKSIEQILDEGIGKSEGKDFYTEEYKMAIERTETENERKYREALEKQQQEKLNSNLKVVDDDKEFLDKNETMAQIIREMDAYSIAYNIPNIRITNNEWDSLFDILYKLFLERGLEDKFYDAMSEIVRFTFAKALLNKINSISVNDFIDNLYYLRNWKIGKKEILIFQKEIISKIQTLKVINFSDFTDEENRKK